MGKEQPDARWLTFDDTAVDGGVGLAYAGLAGAMRAAASCTHAAETDELSARRVIGIVMTL
jgi:hypothetical protein